MPQPHRTGSSIRKLIARLALAGSINLVVYGCSAQAPSPAPLPPVQPPPPVAAIAPPHEVGRPKVTTASFYGPELQGHVTSSGEVYNQHEMTAASRTPPIGSHAQVTNLKTGKSVVVRINDHGPFVKGRGIDLSRAAAHEIGIDHRGTARVRVARIEETPGREGDSWSGTVEVRDTPQVTPVDYANAPNAAVKPSNPRVTQAATIPSPSASPDAPASSDSAGPWFMELVTPSTNSTPATN